MKITVNGRSIKQVENRYYDLFNNQLFMLLFYHDSTKKPFWNNSIVKSNEDPSLYSILSSLNDNYKSNGKFEFILEYPKTESPSFPIIHWRQLKNPLEETPTDKNNQIVRGFQPIHIDDKHFVGLSNSFYSGTFLDGCNGSECWYYAIGVNKSNYNPLIPGPFEIKVSTVALWVRFPTQPKHSCRYNQRFCFHLHILFLLFALK